MEESMMKTFKLEKKKEKKKKAICKTRKTGFI